MSEVPPEPEFDPFQIVGSIQAKVFHVDKAVAEGGFGVVYRAYHEAFRAPVALKCLKVPESFTKQQRADFLERFRNEAELLFRLSAALPEVVRPLQFGVLERAAFVPFLALEWLEGENLASFVDARSDAGKPPVTLVQAIEMLTPIARALSRAHNFSDKDGQPIAVIHRDMKPENVFLATVDGERVPKILDFGIARVKQLTGETSRATGKDTANAFSPAYAAPEQWNPDRFGATGPWTDVYGLALTMVELILGRPPISGDLTAMMGTALSADWRPTPKNKGLKVSDDIDKAFERALTVDPKRRTQSIEAFWTQLELSVGRPASIARRHVVNQSAFATNFDMDAAVKSLRLTPPLGIPVVEGPLAARDSDSTDPRSGAFGDGTQGVPSGLSGLENDATGPAAGGTSSGVFEIGEIEIAPSAARPLMVEPEGAGPRSARVSSLDLHRLPTPPDKRLQAMALGEPPKVTGPVGGGFSPPVWRNPVSVRPPSLGDRLKLPLIVFFLAVAVGAFGVFSVELLGTPLMFGPVRPSIVASGLAFVSVIWGLFKLLD